jgi:hypothetical protein
MLSIIQFIIIWLPVFIPTIFFRVAFKPMLYLIGKRKNSWIISRAIYFLLYVVSSILITTIALLSEYNKVSFYNVLLTYLIEFTIFTGIFMYLYIQYRKIKKEKK